MATDEQSHEAITADDGIHVVNAWNFADNSEREGSDVQSADVGKIARVVSDGSYWLLASLDEGGASWQKIAPLAAGASDIPFRTAIPFSSDSYMAEHLVTGSLTFTIDTANQIKGGGTYLRLVSDAQNVPAFSGMIEHGSSMGYDGRNAVTNLITFWYDGIDHFYSIAQSVGAMPALPGIPIRFATGGMIESGNSSSWTYTGTAVAFISRIDPDRTLAAGTNGTYGFRIGFHGSSHTALIGLNTYATAPGSWNTITYGLYGDTPSGFWGVVGGGTIPAANGNASLPHAIGDRARLRRVGASIFAEVSKNEGVTWTLIHTFAGASTAKLYPLLFSFGGSPAAVGPYGVGLT
jgi:hypothetical protein